MGSRSLVVFWLGRPAELGLSEAEAMGEPRYEQLYAWYLNLVAADNHVPASADVDRRLERSHKCTGFEVGLGHQVAGQGDAATIGGNFKRKTHIIRKQLPLRPLTFRDACSRVPAAPLFSIVNMDNDVLQ